MQMSSLSQKSINENNISVDKISKYKSKEYKDLQKIAMNNIHKRYGPKAKLKYKYLGLITENLIFNKNTHLVTVFKDYMIWDYIEEFLKRYYNGFESVERVPKFASFYKNYLKFFCIPTFKDVFSNEMLHNYSEKKAEMFYNANYRKKKEESEQKDCGLFEESESDEESDSKISKNIEKTIFDETVKKRIERYSPINTSIVLPESEAKLKTDDSGLLVTSSNEESLVDIMKGMTPPIKKKSKKTKNFVIINNKSSNINNNIKNNNYVNNSLNNKSTNNENNISNGNKNKNSSNNNINSNNNNGQGENSSSYRLSQKNLLSSTLNKLNSQTIETLLNSQMKKRNISSKLPNTNKNTNIHIKDNLNNHDNNKNNNGLFKNQFYNNRNNKIISYMGIYKKKSIPKSRNENKLPEKVIKSQTKLNNFMININNNNNVGTITNMKQNQNNNLKNITSIGNYNFNYKQGIQKSRNQQQSISINSNTYTKNSFDKINNIKKNINLNLIKNKNNNVEFILNQLKAHPFFTLKKNSTKKSSYNSSNNNNRKFDDKKMAKKSKILSADYGRNQGLLKGQMEYARYSTKIRSMNNNSNKNKDIRPYSHKYNNSPSVLEFMKKAAIKSMKSNITIKSSNSKDIKIYKQQSSNFSNNESQKSQHEQKTKNKKIKMSFDGIMNKNLKKGYNRKPIINNNGSKHIHNVNININNQINIGGKQFNEIFSFSNLVKKNTNSNNINNNIYALLKNNNKNINYLSRNKNQSLDFNSYINKTNNINVIGNNKMNSITDLQNGSNKNIFKTQNKINNNGHSGTIINNKNKEAKKIRLTNNTLFRSMKIINNKFGNNHF